MVEGMNVLTVIAQRRGSDGQASEARRPETSRRLESDKE